MFTIDKNALATAAAEAVAAVNANTQLTPAARGRWTRAIKKAHRFLSQPSSNIYRAERMDSSLDGLLLLSPQSGKTYHATASGKCECEAWSKGVACWHRAAARLILRHDEKLRARVAPIVLDTRQHRETLARAIQAWTPRPYARRSARTI